MKGSLAAAAPMALSLAQAVISSSQSLATAPQMAARATEVPVEKNAPQIPGHPLTSVVVTQCNLIVAVYVTMNDGRLLRFDKSSSVPVDRLITMAYSAVRSERVEVSCQEVGSVGYETHDPV